MQIRPLTLFTRWLDWTPPSSCGFDFGIGEALAAVAAGSAAAAPEAAATLGAAELTGGGLAATGGLFGAETAATAASAATAATGAAASGGLASTLSTVGAILGLGGTLIQARSALNEADFAAASRRAEAAALKIKAGQDAAAAEQVQISRERQATLALSRTQALAASSGAAATDPTVLTGEQNLAAQGEYNAQSGLYEGVAEARADQLQAQIDLFKADNAKRSGPIAAAGTILSGISAFAGARTRAQTLLQNQNQYGF